MEKRHGKRDYGNVYLKVEKKEQAGRTLILVIAKHSIPAV